jgi:hypothetical protein
MGGLLTSTVLTLIVLPFVDDRVQAAVAAVRRGWTAAGAPRVMLAR